jgi:hypothetical protein
MKSLATTSSTSPASAWLEPHPRLDGLTLIDHLFNRLDGLYPHRWRSAFANDRAIENWRTAWAEGLSDEGVTMGEVRAGLRVCRRQQDWPPSFAEFLRACRPAIDHSSALLEAIEQMPRRESGSDTWSHPAIYWAAVKIGSYDLSRKTPKELDPEWRRAFQDQMARSEWWPIPARLPALPAPGETHTPDRGREAIAEMLARLKGAADAHDAGVESR